MYAPFMMKLEGLSHVVSVQDFDLSSNLTVALVNESMLNRLNRDMFVKLSPVAAVLLVILCLGLAGNLMVSYIFCRKMNKNFQNRLLMWLGILDLLAIGVGVASEVYDIRHYYMYPSEVTCKVLRFLTTFTSLSSILVLMVIATDRYRKVCRPLHRQFHLPHIHLVIIIVIIVSIIFSAPTLFIYGLRTFATSVPAVYGQDCSISDARRGGVVPLAYESILATALGLTALVLIFVYFRIWFEIRRHRRYLSTHSMMGTVCMSEPEPSELSSLDDRHKYSINRTESTKPLRPRLSSLFTRKSNEANRGRLVPGHGHELPKGDNSLEGDGVQMNQETIRLKGKHYHHVDNEEVDTENDRCLINVSNTDQYRPSSQNKGDTSEVDARLIQQPCATFPEATSTYLSTTNNSNFCSELHTNNEEKAKAGVQCLSLKNCNRCDENVAGMTEFENQPSTLQSCHLDETNWDKTKHSLIQNQDGNSNKSDPSKNIRLAPVKTCKSGELKRRRKVQVGYSARKTTVIATVITVSFVLSYLPTIVCTILLVVHRDFDHNLGTASLVFYNIVLRSYLANNVINVIVYGSMNKAFQEHAKRLVCFWQK